MAGGYNLCMPTNLNSFEFLSMSRHKGYDKGYAMHRVRHLREFRRRRTDQDEEEELLLYGSAPDPHPRNRQQHKPFVAALTIT